MGKIEPAGRIDFLLSTFGVNAKTFSESIGLDRPDRIYYVLRGRNGISVELAELITKRYPSVSYLWITTGDGEPFIFEAESTSPNEISEALSIMKVTPKGLAEIVGMEYLNEITDALKGIPPRPELLSKIRQVSGKKGTPILTYADMRGSVEESINQYRGDYYRIPFGKIDCIMVCPVTLHEKGVRAGDLVGINKVEGGVMQVGRLYVLDTSEGVIVCEALANESDNVTLRGAERGQYSMPKSAIDNYYLIVVQFRPR